MNNKVFNQICNNVKIYLQNEFQITRENNELFDDNLRCSLLYSFKGESDEFEYQVYLDLKGKQFIKETSYSNCIKHYEYERYNNWSELAEVTTDLSFDDLYHTNENLEEIEKEIAIIS